MRRDPPRIVWSGILWRDVRPAADLYRKERPAVSLTLTRGDVLSLLLACLLALVLVVGIVVAVVREG